MRRASVILLTDRPDRSSAIAAAIRTVADCAVVGANEFMTRSHSISGAICDLEIDRRRTGLAISALRSAEQELKFPIMFLMRTSDGMALQKAKRMGVSACLSSLTDPHMVVAALFRQIAPDKSATDLLVEYSAVRTADLLSSMFASAAIGQIDVEAVEAGLDPIVDALRGGGLRRWLLLVQEHDDTTLRHCLLVAGLAAHFALYLGLSATDRSALIRAGLVHDVGKSRIPQAILNKPGPLDSAEMATMRTHAAVGHDILLASGMKDPVILAATRHHHEMLDGSGYPDGLRGDAIPDEVRLLTICDICAALIEHRPYRPPMPQAEALRILNSMAGHGLESALVQAFTSSLLDGDTIECSKMKSVA